MSESDFLLAEGEAPHTTNGAVDPRHKPDHGHAWPRDDKDRAELARCETCGQMLLRQFVASSEWVVRRVERIAFIDDRTVRRRVSVDYLAPNPAVALTVNGGRPIRVLPIAIMRRKSLVNFDLMRHDGQPISLVGLRENQAFTAAITRSTALAALRRLDGSLELDGDVEEFLDGVVHGDQLELNDAYKLLNDAPAQDPLGVLAKDLWFRAVVDRLADSFILFALDSSQYGGRQVIKFAYDEPLTLRYREAGYKRIPDPTTLGTPTYQEGRFLGPLRLAPLLAHLGLTPTLIRFPVPAAELAASFHFEVQAPPEVSISRAKLIAGRPNATRPTSPDPAPRPRRHESEWLPSFDAVIGGYPTIDLHVTDVPYGSLSRAQVALQPTPKGWLSMAVLACSVSTATLTIAWLAHNVRSDVASTLMVTFAAALVALLARNDPHRMITRLLSTIRQLAAISALLTFAGALTFAFVKPADARPVLGWLAVVSVIPTVMAVAAWAMAMIRLSRRAKRSPWEQRRPTDETAPSVDEDARYHTEILCQCREAPRPYDRALELLRFDEPAIKVASSEGCRRRFEVDGDVLAQVSQRGG